MEYDSLKKLNKSVKISLIKKLHRLKICQSEKRAQLPCQKTENLMLHKIKSRVLTIWKRQVEFSCPSVNKLSLHQEVQQKIGKANDCSFNTNALSELLLLLQTRNSNHSMNQSQSISQACLWQTEDLEKKKKELLARHVLQACFCSPSLLR